MRRCVNRLLAKPNIFLGCLRLLTVASGYHCQWNKIGCELTGKCKESKTKNVANVGLGSFYSKRDSNMQSRLRKTLIFLSPHPMPWPDDAFYYLALSTFVPMGNTFIHIEGSKWDISGNRIK